MVSRVGEEEKDVPARVLASYPSPPETPEAIA